MKQQLLRIFPMATKAKTKTTQVLSTRVGASLGAQFVECVERLGYLNRGDALRDAVRDWVNSRTVGRKAA